MVGGLVMEILWCGIDSVVEDEEWLDEFDGCFVSGCLRVVLVFEESFFV